MINPEIVRTAGNISPLLAISLLPLAAFTRRQVKAIRQRDNNRCQFPTYSEKSGWLICGRQDRLEVHHIIPQRYAKQVLNWSEDRIDHPKNGITLCQAHHQDVIHPDIVKAKREYGEDRASFDKCFENRDRLVKEGYKYWNDDWDRALAYKAEENTLSAQEWNFPKKRGSRVSIIIE